MSNIIDPVTENTYLGMHTVQLSGNWDGPTNPRNYKTYLEMRDWLLATNTAHRFHWINTWQYLPDSVSINGDCAVIFMLKYGIGN